MERKMSGWWTLLLGLVLGGLIGVILGTILGDLSVGMILGAGLGLLIGLVIGVLIDAFRRDKAGYRKPDDDLIRMIEMDLDTSTKVILHPVVESVEGAVTLNRSVFGLLPPGLKFLNGPPTDWPQNITWLPFRFFGPFCSDFSQIEINVRGPSTAQGSSAIAWYYNDYFANHPDAPQYRPFYPGQNLPTQKLTVVPAAPGYMPLANGPGQFVCSLDCIAFSSRYGGTVELTFSAEYDVGLEIRFGAYLWDLRDLELRIYVAPTTAGFQTPASAYLQGPVSCDILSSEQTAYSVPADGNPQNPAVPIQALDDVHEAELTQALAALSREIVNNVEADARRFVAGFLSSLFPELLLPNTIINSIIISDDFIDPITSQGIPYVTVRFRASDVSATPTYWEQPEVRVTLESWHALNNELQPGPSRIFELEQGEDSSWMFAGQWSLENEIPNLDFILLRLSGVEIDTFSPDDVFETFELRVVLSQNGLLANHNAGRYGLIEERSSRFSTDFADSSLRVFFNMDIRIYLGLR